MKGVSGNLGLFPRRNKACRSGRLTPPASALRYGFGERTVIAPGACFRNDQLRRCNHATPDWWDMILSCDSSEKYECQRTTTDRLFPRRNKECGPGRLTPPASALRYGLGELTVIAPGACFRNDQLRRCNHTGLVVQENSPILPIRVIPQRAEQLQPDAAVEHIDYSEESRVLFFAPLPDSLR